MKKILLGLFMLLGSEFSMAQCESVFKLSYATTMEYNGITFYIKGGTSKSDYIPVINWCLHQGWINGDASSMNKCMHIKGKRGKVEVTFVAKDSFFNRSKNEQKIFLADIAKDMEAHELAGKTVMLNAVSMNRANSASSE